MSDDGAPRPTGSMIALVLLADRMGGFMLLLLRLEIWLGRSDGLRRRLLLGHPGKIMRPADCANDCGAFARTDSATGATESGRREETTSPRHARQFTPTPPRKPAAVQNSPCYDRAKKAFADRRARAVVYSFATRPTSQGSCRSSRQRAAWR